MIILISTWAKKVQYGSLQIRYDNDGRRLRREIYLVNLGELQVADRSIGRGAAQMREAGNPWFVNRQRYNSVAEPHLVRVSRGTAAPLRN